MANRLQLKRGIGAPGTVFYEGEPIYDKTNKVLYVGNAGGTGGGSGSAVASATAYSTVVELLTAASSSAGGSVKFYEDTDNGNHYIQLSAPASVSASKIFVLPAVDGSAGDLLKTDGNGNLSFSPPAPSNFTVNGDTGTDDVSTGQTLNFTGGDGVDTAVTDNTITFSAQRKSNGGLVIESGALAVDLGATSITGTLAVSDGGTGASNASDARANLGLSTAFNLVVAQLTGQSTISISPNANLTVAGTANEVEVAYSSGTLTVGLPDNVTIAQDLTVTGNLRVVGTAVTFEAQTVKVEDRIIELGLIDGSTPSTYTTWDTGILFNYRRAQDEGQSKKSGVIWLNNQFMAMVSAVSESSDGQFPDVPQISVSSYAPVASGGLYIGGISSGDEVINSSKQAVNLVFDGGTY